MMPPVQFSSVIRVASVQRNDRKTNLSQEFAHTKVAQVATWDLSAMLHDLSGPFIKSNDDLNREMEAARAEFLAKDPDYKGTGNVVMAGTKKYTDIQSFRFHKQMYMVTGEDAQKLSIAHANLEAQRQDLFKNRNTNGLVLDPAKRDYKYHLDPTYRSLLKTQQETIEGLVAKATKTLSMRVSDIQRHLPNLPVYRVHQVEITG